MSASVSRLETGDELQRRIVMALQDGLPVARHPYLEVAQELGISEGTLLKNMRQMLGAGTIRRIGLVPNHYALGYRFNLMVVWDIDDTVADTVGATIGELDFVSHCYRRPRRPGWPYNLFVMVHGKTRAEVEQKIERLRELVGDGYRDHTVLKSTRMLKKTGLRLRSGEK
jgi:DNA-binding Lrp family transcriptional regulator